MSRVKKLTGKIIVGQIASPLVLQDTGTTSNDFYYGANSVQSSPSRTASGKNVAATVTLAAPGTGRSWVISGIWVTLAGGTPGTLTAATSTLTGSSSVAPSDGDTVVVQGKTYTFKTTLTVSPGVEGQVLIGTTGSTDAAYTNLAAALNHSAGNGTTYWSAAANPYVSSAAMASHNIVISALLPGTQGNAITTTAAGTAPGSWTSTVLGSGAGALLQVQDGTTTVAGATGVPVNVFNLGFGVSALSEKIPLEPPIKCGANNAVTITLGAGGSSVWGLLNVNAFVQ